MRNQFAVGAVGKRIEINNLAPRPSLTVPEALELAAYLAAAALELKPGDDAENVGNFLKMIMEAAGGEGELSEALRSELEG